MNTISVIRWTARALGVLFLFLVSANFLSEESTFEMMSGQERWFSFALLMMMAGIIIEWMWSTLGASLMVAAFIGMILIENSVQLGRVFPIIFLLGLVHLVLNYFFTSTASITKGAI